MRPHPHPPCIRSFLLLAFALFFLRSVYLSSLACFPLTNVNGAPYFQRLKPSNIPCETRFKKMRKVGTLLILRLTVSVALNHQSHLKNILPYLFLFFCATCPPFLHFEAAINLCFLSALNCHAWWKMPFCLSEIIPSQKFGQNGVVWTIMPLNLRLTTTICVQDHVFAYVDFPPYGFNAIQPVKPIL